MEIARLDWINVKITALRAAEVLRAGGVILYPTDTLYGLGVDALSDEAVARVYAIKGREEKKPMHCIVADLEMAQTFGELNEAALRFAKEFLPGPLTLVVKKKRGVDSGIARNVETIGIRIPKNEFCLALAREFGRPYTATSANISGETAEHTINKMLAQFGEAAKGIDLIVDAAELPEREPSTVVDVSGADPIILREGAIPAAEIWDVAAG